MASRAEYRREYRANNPEKLKRWSRSHYLRNKDRLNAKTKSIQQRAADIIWIAKKLLGCKSCDETRPFVLDFHHVDPSTKIRPVANYASGCFPVSAILAEIKRCECLCANCHREQHFYGR